MEILGIASFDGSPVAAFNKEDADRVLFFCKSGRKDQPIQDSIIFRPPGWHARRTSRKSIPSAGIMDSNGLKRKLNRTLIRPVPHRKLPPKNPFLGDGTHEIQVMGVTDFIPSGQHDILSVAYAYGGSRFDGVSSQVENCSIPTPSRQMDFTYELDKHVRKRHPIELCSKVVSRAGFHFNKGINWKG